MNMDLTELEQDFRRTWRDFEPQRYAQFLGRASQDQRSELLARLLSVELEFVYQPPASSEAEQQSCIDNSNDDESDDDDRRVTPCVQLFLLRFPELAHKPDLIIRLIVLEYALRLRHDRLPPNPESYLPLCEENQERLIKLLELTERKLPLQRSDTFDAEPVKHSDSTVKESQVSQAIAIDPLPLNLGCFLLLRLLGRGGMGYVHAAIDLRSTAQVAVKVMRRVDAWSIYRFIEEFSWLSQLSHPNLVKLYDAFCDGHIRYFSMELVEGTTIRQWFKQLPGAADHRWNELRRVLTQLASAVNYLHERGVLHCDIKCSNMMISAGHRAVLLDLGLAVRAGDENRMVGTLQYMAPEVLGGAAPTSASDWHSFGVMIFEVVTDSFPPVQIDLSSDNSSDQKYRMDHEKLEQGLATCPEDLAKLCMDLLSIPPEQRPLGSEILGRLGDPGASLGHFSTQPECTGREWELQRIDAAVRPLPGQAASLVVVQGESGSGKTTLVQCWMKHLRPSHSLLLSLCCYQQDHTPVRLLNMLVQELVPSLARLPASHWRPSLKARFKEIRILFPQVQQLLSNDVLPSLVSKGHDGLLATPETSRQVSIQALLEWLIELSHGQRLVLCIDDVQWADNESLRGLRRLLCHERKFQGAVLVVDESEESRVLDLLVRDESSADSEPPPFHCSLVPLQP
ncbi:MAG: serine/threonine-protein kinase PknK, partial [Planctomycetales bacterium]|nr:serine/threonine-protein kinase PknK [Planctomycetales bacterium]